MAHRVGAGLAGQQCRERNDDVDFAKQIRDNPFIPAIPSHDLERLEGGVDVSALIQSLRKKGVKEETISSAMAEAQGS